MEEKDGHHRGGVCTHCKLANKLCLFQGHVIDQHPASIEQTPQNRSSDRGAHGEPAHEGVPFRGAQVPSTIPELNWIGNAKKSLGR